MAAKLTMLAVACVAFLSCFQAAAASRAAAKTSLARRTRARFQAERERMRREREASVAGLTENMTVGAALRALRRSPGAEPGVVLLVERTLHRTGTLGRPMLRTRGGALAQEQSNPTGYSGLDGAKTMLNDMLKEVQQKHEFETSRCQEFFQQQCGLMEVCRQDTSSSNARAAHARGLVLQAQAEINVCEENIPRLKQELEEHNLQCSQQLADLDTNLRIVLDDIAVMTRILEMTDCRAGASLLLLECQRRCRAQRAAFISVDNADVRRQLDQLRSPQLRMLVQAGLRDLARASGGRQAEALLQDAHGTSPLQYSQDNVTNFTNEPLPQEAIPEDPCGGIGYDDGLRDGKCSLGSNPQCYTLQAKFLAIQSGILDKKSELEEDIKKLEESCENTMKNYEAEIQTFGNKLNSEQTKLAMATESENTAAEEGRMKGQEHVTLEKDMHQTRDDCSKNLRTFESEECSLKKIRGELYKMAGSVAFFQDCEVSAWQEQECSASCGGGDQLLERKVLSQPQGGMTCPPLRAFKKCNEQPCPVDCVTSVWSAWSACSAQCGGGVMERIRMVETQPRHDGQPCGATSEAVACNVEACDADCELAEWSAWSHCSKQCDFGRQERRRAVKVGAKGEGKCWTPDDQERLITRPCNSFTCTGLRCASKVDVVVLLDGSGSIGAGGWAATKVFARYFADAFAGADATMSVILFSGPRTWSDYRQCVGTANNSMTQADMASVCGVNVVQHFSSDMAATKTNIDNLAWPQGTTLTSVALRMAQDEVRLSRQDAPCIVLVVSDGLPLSPRMTAAAAHDVKKTCRLMWAPVNLAHSSVASMRSWASKPVEENMVSFPSFGALERPTAPDRLIADICKHVTSTVTSAR